MRRCSRCVFPDTVPGITFDEQGVCNFCRAYTGFKVKGEQAWLDIVAQAKQQSQGRYDCLVPLSGGRDSSYILYMAVAEYKLRVLAVTYDNEFRVGQADKNIDTACRRLNVDALRVRSKNDIAHKMVYHSVRSSLRCGFKVQKPQLCDACAYGYRSAVYRTAQQDRIPLIIWGDSDDEKTESMQSIVQRAQESQMSGNTHWRRRLRKLSTLSAYKYLFHLCRQRAEFPVPKNKILSLRPPRLHDPSVKEVHFYEYIPWDRKRIVDTITNKLGWQKPAGRFSSWRFDCALVSLVNYYFILSYGCTKACFGYCRMVNSGRMTREEALEQEEQSIADHCNGIRSILQDHVGLSSKEVDRLAKLDGVILP